MPKLSEDSYPNKSNKVESSSETNMSHEQLLEALKKTILGDG